MIIYTNGCSHSAGTALSMPDKNFTWPNQIAKHYNAKLIDRSRAGGSNEKIVRETINDIIRFSKLGDLPDLVILQWTDTSRFETPTHYINNKNNKLTYSWDGWLQHRPASNTTTVPWLKKYLSYIDDLDEKYYDYLAESFYEFYRFNHRGSLNCDYDLLVDDRLFDKYCSQILSTNLTLKSLGIRVVNMAFFRFIKKNSISEHIRANTEWVIDPYYGMNQSFMQNGFKTCNILMPGTKNYIDGHFMADAHTKLKEWLVDYIENGYVVYENIS